MSSTSPELNLSAQKTILRAGAGAGKTTRLTQEFLTFASNFKEKHTSFPRIVVTTFTRKATQELKERLLKKALEGGRSDLFQFVSSKSQVQISTIHGVLSLFLSRYGSVIGLTPDYRIMNDAEIRRGARKIMRRHLLENPNLQELLEEYDFKVLENVLLKYFAEHVVFPEMKFITESELRTETENFVARLRSRLHRVCVEISQETSHEKWQDYVARLDSIELTLTEGKEDALFEGLQSFWDNEGKPAYLKAKPPFSNTLNEELEEVRSSIDKLLAEPRYRPDFWRRHQKNCELLSELAARFCIDFMQTKIEKGLLSMGDLESLAFKMIHEFPESAEKFSLEWDYWMVDEYQDTSPVQVRLLKALIGNRPQFVVGDPQQSIYLFRGARSEVFQEKVDEVQREEGRVEVQLTNYRSSPELLAFFNFYFTKLGSQFAAMTAAPDKPCKGNTEPVVQVLRTETLPEGDESAEALGVLARIQELLQEGVRAEQICVLGRTHKTLEDIAKVAQSYGVPLQLHSGSGFYERREVLDALAILKFLVNPHDNANFVTLLRSPWLVVSDTELAQYCHSSRHSFWREALKFIAQKPAHHPLSLLRSLIVQSETKGLSWILKRALIDLGIFDYSAKIDSSGRREANLWKLVFLLSQEERRPGFNFLDFLDASLESLSTDEGGEDADATPVVEPQRVNFMTVHASKGLQFEHVILPGMGQDPRASQAGVFSIRETDGAWTLKVRNEETQAMVGSVLADQITEELRRREAEEFNRVLYVALTRAKEGVSLFWDKKVGKKSWAAQCPLNTEEGFHQEADFSYVVRVENSTPQKFQEEVFVEKKLRPLWAPSQAQVKSRSISVTELVAPSAMMASPGTKHLGAALARAQQGTHAHRIFESLKYTQFEELLEISDEELKKPLLFLKDNLDLPLLKIIENGQVEWGFSLKYQDCLMQGQIDLWGIVDQTLWMVDYKTGSQKYSETAFRQLEVYVWALAQMDYLAGVELIKLAVVYPLDEVVKVQTLPSLPEMKQKIEGLIQNYSLV